MPTLADYRKRAPHPARQEGGRRLSPRTDSPSPNLPLISIVTVVRNGAATLERAIQSVLRQSYPNIEYIIVDGASTDETPVIIRRHEDRIYWISEPDGGIFDAMNKGVSLAAGEYIALLNADDFYRPDALELVARAIRESSGEVDCVYSDYVFLVGDIGIKKVFRATLGLTRGMTLCHPGMFVSRKAYEKYGLYDTRYKYAADFDLALRLRLAGAKFVKVDAPVVYFTSGGAAEQNLVNASFEAMGSIRRQAGIFSTFPYACMFVKRAVLRSVNGIVTVIFGKRAGLRVKRWYYGESDDGIDDQNSPARDGPGLSG